MDSTLCGGFVMVVTLFLLGECAGGAVTVVKRGCVVSLVATVTVWRLLAVETTGLVRVVWISALRAKATLSFSLICSICSCSSCSSPGWGGAGAGAGAGGGTVTGGVVVTTVGVATDTKEDVTTTEGGAEDTEGVVATAAGGALDTVALGRAEEEVARENTRLAKEAAGPPFSYKLVASSSLGLADSLLVTLAPPPLASEAARRASRRRVFRVSRLN